MYLAAIGSAHLCQPALLAPGWGARWEQLLARLQQTQIVRSENSLTLMAAFEHLDTALMRDRRTHEVTRAGHEARAIGRPPLFNPRDIRPRQPIIRIHLNVRVIGIVVRPRLEAFRCWPVE